MTSVSRFFPASYSITLLRSAVLAITLIMQISPARAEVVTLVCQNELNPGSSFTLRVNYDQKIVDLLSSDGTARFSAAARITEGDVYWEVTPRDYDGTKFEGGLNRLSGQGWVWFPDKNSRTVYSVKMGGPCRRATQKF